MGKGKSSEKFKMIISSVMHSDQDPKQLMDGMKVIIDSTADGDTSPV